MDAHESNGGRAAADGWQGMGRRWPDWWPEWLKERRMNGAHTAPGLDARRAPDAPALDDRGSMCLADELAERRQRRSAIAAERAALDAVLVPENRDSRIPSGWEVWRPLGEPGGWLDPGGPPPVRDLDDWRDDVLDELDQLGPAVQLAAGELDAAGTIGAARARLRRALGILDGIEHELDELDLQAAAKLDAARHPDSLAGGEPARLDEQPAELESVGGELVELGGRGELVEVKGDGGELVDQPAELGDQAGELGELIDQGDELGELGGLGGDARGDA